jgi:shikimate dehydrogenase
MIGAVNTVCVDSAGRLIGENTDGKGFLRGLRQLTDPRGKRITLLGAGGAARAIAVELALAGAASIAIYNRTPDRGRSMVQHLVDTAKAPVTFHPWTSMLSLTPDTDILVNATSIGLFPDVDAMPDITLDRASPSLIVCDVIPNPPITPLLKRARSRNLQTLDGLSMLVYQGMIGFELWTGRTPSEQAMKSALQAAFQ